MDTNRIKIHSKYNNLISLRIMPGHYATTSSHVNFLIDMGSVKTRLSEAKAVAHAMAQDYLVNTVIDTIVCMDGSDVIGTCLADKLVESGVMSYNSHHTIYIVNPEQNAIGQLMFRDNTLRTIKNKNVLLILATVTTGKTVEKAMECIEYYGGKLVGVSSIFTAVDNVYHHRINGIFHSNDIPGYQTFSAHECPMCNDKIPIDGIVNSYGFARF